MAFMEPEIVHGAYVQIDTPDGTDYLPADIVGTSTDPADYRDYVESRSDPADWTVTIQEGWLGRLSAAGYLDCTAWTPGDSEEGLLAELREMYGDDDED